MNTTPNRDATPNAIVPYLVLATLWLPEFWQVDSELSFLSVEPLFRRHRVTSQTVRYDYVIGTLLPAVIAIVRDILPSRPPDNPYDTLNDELMHQTTESEQRRLQQLLTSEELGDRTPTELLRRMRHLIGDHSAALDAYILRELFLQSLPQQVRVILSVSSTETLNSLACMADKIMDIGVPYISAIKKSRESTLSAPVCDDHLDLLQADEELKSKLDQLATELSALKVDHRRKRATRTALKQRKIAKSASRLLLVPPPIRCSSSSAQTVMPVCGKRTGHALTAASVSGPTNSLLLYVIDRITKVRYLIDTGAEVCVVPPTLEDHQRRQTSPSVTAVNEGRQFHILTDLKSLTCQLTATNSAHTPCEIRQLAYISEFKSDIWPISGKDNPVADALSRIEINAIMDERPPVNF
ncbi:uncharacterized protein LOC142784505 [Rhipicephalus microplus]|uniref:uncharacterized protein LOC142784505 n=1 Tax=Rhipicephalus microplus TaxID=6941 RepID=UPI003F6D83A5